jgi:hypothetical protein
MSKDRFLTRRYRERQMIVVSDEQFIAAAEEESRKKECCKKPGACPLTGMTDEAPHPVGGYRLRKVIRFV